MTPNGWRKLWNWHLWLGLGLLLPLLWWMGTAVVFALWPIEEVRGRTFSTGQKAPTGTLRSGMGVPPELLEGARAVTLRNVEGHPVAIVERDPKALLWDLEARQPLGECIPLPWAQAAAQRDYKGSFALEAVYLYPQQGPGQRASGSGPLVQPLPSEYTGPLPVYAFHLQRGPAMHLYVDALSGEVRARRTRVWRFYDWCFRLHSLEIVGDGTKRILTLAICALWFGLGSTGLFMAWRRLRKSPR